MGWQKTSGYNRRALVEAGISRYKRVSGDALRSHTDRRQATGIAITVGVLNRMLDFDARTIVPFMLALPAIIFWLRSYSSHEM
jgi:hypothetical protein